MCNFPVQGQPLLLASGRVICPKTEREDGPLATLEIMPIGLQYDPFLRVCSGTILTCKFHYIWWL